MGWVREGECPPERCQGRCCTHIGMWMQASDESTAFVEVLRVRGVDVKSIDGMYLIDYPQRCQWLTDDGLCALHPAMSPPADLPARPDFCERWPEEPGQLVNDEGCGYVFHWEDDPPVTEKTQWAAQA